METLIEGEDKNDRNDKLVLLNMITKTSELMQELIKSQEKIINSNGVKYFKIKIAESRGYKVIWEDYKAVKIVEKEKK